MIHKLNPKLSIAITFIFAGFLITSCDDSTTGVQPSESNVKIYTVKNIEATGGSRGSAGNYVLYSLTKNKVITDSTSKKWDIGFSGTNIIINNTVSGPGQAGAVVLDIPFNSVDIAPSKDYKVDTDTTYAVNGWYDYTGIDRKPHHAVIPYDDVTIVVRTADGEHYAKVKVMSWYKDNPKPSELPKGDKRDSGFYTFKYAIQGNGSRNFK